MQWTLGLAVLLASGICVPGLAESAVDLASLPADAKGPISAALGKGDSSYWVHQSAAGLRAQNPRQALGVEFTREGVEVRSQILRWGLKTLGYGYGDALHPVKAVAPTGKANRVEYRRNEVIEWYENGPLGFEQGFTLVRPPAQANSQTLTLELELSGDLLPELAPGGRGLELRRRAGKPALRYTGLEARDATGRLLRSWLEVCGERVLIRVEAAGARYPVVADPWIQQAELTASDGRASDEFGYSVAVSGNTVVVGAPQHWFGSSYDQGAAYVFVDSGGTWSQQAELSASDGAPGDYFGWSVAVSGSTAIVGAPQHAVGSNFDQGAVYVFVESDGTWSQQAELTASDGKSDDEFGKSVAISGNTAVVGAFKHPYSTSPGPGAAYVFVESAGTWSQQAELTASDGAAGDEFGSSVALSGSTAVAGAPGHHSVEGAAYVFVESAGTWSQEAELTASNGAAGEYFGWSVAVSGGTAVVGAFQHPYSSKGAGPGAAYVFLESGGKWSQQTELTASDGAPGDEFGYSIALSGNTAVVGAPLHKVGSNAAEGAAYVFVEIGGEWSLLPELIPSDGGPGDEFGWSSAVSGGTAVLGALFHTVGSNGSQGTAYVFSAPSVTSVSITPQNGSGQSQAFTGAYSDSSGASDLNDVRMLIASAQSAAFGCYVRYVVASGQLELLNNSGNTWSAGLTPGGSGSVSNSQCTLSASGSSVTASGDMLSVVFNISFTDFSGTKNMWLYAADNENQNTGLDLRGVFTAEGSTAPVTVSVSPRNGSGGAQKFTALYSDTNGASDLNDVRMLITSAESAASACYVRYVAATGQLELLNNAGNAWSAGLTPGGSGSASNSQCTLFASGSSVTASGDMLTVVFNISFTDFIGAKNIWLYAADSDNQNTGLDLRGTFTVEGSTAAGRKPW